LQFKRSWSEALLNCPQSVDNDKPLSFRIVRTLPRASLPLIYIDNSDTPTRIFSANLPQLDHDAQSPPLVAVARVEAASDQSLYAVERVGNRRYALCKLAAWLRESHIEALVSPASTVVAPLPSPPVDTSNLSWWQTAQVHPKQQNTSRKAPRLSLCLRLPPQAESTLQLEPHLESQPLDQSLIPDETCETPQDFLDRFLLQYLDTLYLSKTPLAFFTKGSLSRLRAAFTTGQVQGASLPDLVQFLRSLIHSSSTADKKYRDKLPELLKELPSQHVDHDNTAATKKKQRKKKLKPDKYGLLPDEANFFAKWWYQDESSAPSDETAEQSLKRKSQQLRTRETFMQVVLLLEILSLEALPEFKMQEEAPQSKSKKSDSITTSLELLLDRLCIWHSLHSADLLGDAPKPDKSTNDGANQLHSFCVDVVIPFYMSRTQEHASLVNKKLGGPGAAANTKPKLSRKLSEADVKTTNDKKARRPLSRVATESFSQPAKVPRSFSRSATDSQVVPVKSETPELNISSILPRRDSQPSLARKSDVLEKHRLRQREVDFGAIAAANEAKAKKKQEVEQKLKDAISALKKPSRAAVSGEFVDAVEQRKRMAEGRARPPLHKRKSSSVAQVAATPKNGHKTSAIAATPHHIPAPSFARPAVHSSGPSMVPSSNIKQKSLSFAHFSPVNEVSDDDGAVPATDHRPRHKDALAETPSKPRVTFTALPSTSPDDEEQHPSFVGQARGDSSPLRESPTLLKTPSKPQRPKFSITPSKPTPPLNFGKVKAKSSLAAPPQTITAIAGSKNPLASTGQHTADDNVSKDPPTDIYATLGWDDDLDDD
jgi:DNA replication regulator SLD3